VRSSRAIEATVRMSLVIVHSKYSFTYLLTYLLVLLLFVVVFRRVQLVLVPRNENDNHNCKCHESEDDGEEESVDDVGQFLPLLRPVALGAGRLQALARLQQSPYRRRHFVSVGRCYCHVRRRYCHCAEQFAITNELQRPNPQSTNIVSRGRPVSRITGLACLSVRPSVWSFYQWHKRELWLG